MISTFLNDVPQGLSRQTREEFQQSAWMIFVVANCFLAGMVYLMIAAIQWQSLLNMYSGTMSSVPLCEQADVLARRGRGVSDDLGYAHADVGIASTGLSGGRRGSFSPGDHGQPVGGRRGSFSPEEFSGTQRRSSVGGWEHHHSRSSPSAFPAPFPPDGSSPQTNGPAPTGMTSSFSFKQSDADGVVVSTNRRSPSTSFSLAARGDAGGPEASFSLAQSHVLGAGDHDRISVSHVMGSPDLLRQPRMPSFTIRDELRVALENLVRAPTINNRVKMYEDLQRASGRAAASFGGGTATSRPSYSSREEAEVRVKKHGLLSGVRNKEVGGSKSD